MKTVNDFVNIMKSMSRPSIKLGLDTYYLIGMEETEGGVVYEAFFVSQLGIVVYGLIPCNPIEIMNDPNLKFYHRCPHYESWTELVGLWHRFKNNPVLSWNQMPADVDKFASLS